MWSGVEAGSKRRQNSGAGGHWWGGEIGMPRGRGGFKKGVGGYVYVGVLMREGGRRGGRKGGGGTSPFMKPCVTF